MRSNTTCVYGLHVGGAKLNIVGMDEIEDYRWVAKMTVERYSTLGTSS
jgi:hypothetical protein